MTPQSRNAWRAAIRKGLGSGLLLLCLLGSGPARPAGAPFLWQVEAPAATHYLLGSFHVLPASAYPLPEALQQAFDSTVELVIETDPAALAAPETRDYLLDAATSGPGLAAELDDAGLLDAVRVRARSLGLPAQVCDPLRAWFCALTLGLSEFQRAGMEPGLGLDQHFHRQARSAQRPVSWLEDARAQLNLFVGMDGPMARQFLRSTLDDFERPELRPQALVDLWRRNDTAAMARFIEQTARDDPRFHQRLMARRNRAWAQTLAPRLRQDRPLLVVVGAGHLVGPDNLRDELTARGLVIRAVGGN